MDPGWNFSLVTVYNHFLKHFAILLQQHTAHWEKRCPVAYLAFLYNTLPKIVIHYVSIQKGRRK